MRLSYSVSKFALRAMTSTLAQELAPSGVTVNGRVPGPGRHIHAESYGGSCRSRWTVSPQ